MRDPNRISPLLAEFEALWKQHPDLRFGQLVIILQGRLGGTLDPFYTEDEEMLDVIRRLSSQSQAE